MYLQCCKLLLFWTIGGSWETQLLLLTKPGEMIQIQFLVAHTVSQPLGPSTIVDLAFMTACWISTHLVKCRTHEGFGWRGTCPGDPTGRSLLLSWFFYWNSPALVVESSFPDFFSNSLHANLQVSFFFLLYCHKVSSALIRLSSLYLNCPRELLDHPSPADQHSSLLWATCGCPLPSLEFPSPFFAECALFGGYLWTFCLPSYIMLLKRLFLEVVLPTSASGSMSPFCWLAAT